MAFSKTALGLALIALVSASPVAISRDNLEERQLASPYSLPQNDPAPLLRAAGITTKRATFLYGPGIGGGPSSPTGPLALTYVAAASAISDGELALEETVATNDTAVATAEIAQYDGLQTLDDYVKLYDGLWGPSSAPTGVDPGMLTNYTQDLLFSMERLSFQPYAVKRLNPASDSIPFAIPDATVTKITGSTLSSLFKAGRLFFADFSDQAQLPRVLTPQYAGNCQAYFYISPKNGQFLPLAIRTGTGNNLVYTPLDSPNDWLLAKIMYNVNDFFFGQFHHLANTHYVAEIVYQAAVRTLSQDHPVMAILDRLMSGALGIRELALAVLFAPGGDIDRFFAFTGTAAADYSAQLYSNGVAGNFQSNYFQTNLQRRGLINPATGPALQHFPFFEDATQVYNGIHTFMTSFVNSYYTSNAALNQDNELQAWFVEANGPAEVLDFPTGAQVTTTSQLVDMLTHMAHLVSSSHHSVNTNQLISGSGVFPFHPWAIYKPVPDAKGVTNVASYLPPVSQCIGAIKVQADFSRPLLANSNRTLTNMFNDPVLLSRMNSATKAANTKFISAMNAFSKVVSSRTFDGSGLSQGMPFVWKALDPNVAPFTLTI